MAPTYEDSARPVRQETVATEPYLVLMLEGERPLAGSARYALADADEVVIGRGDQRASERTVHGRTRRLSLAVPDRRVSTRHGRLAWSGQGWTYEDLSSRNGSFLNGERIARRATATGSVWGIRSSSFE